MIKVANLTRSSLWSLLVLDPELISRLPPDISCLLRRFRSFVSSAIFVIAIVSAFLLKITFVFMTCQIQKASDLLGDQRSRGTGAHSNAVWLICVWILVAIPEIYSFLRCLVSYRRSSVKYITDSSKTKGILSVLLFEMTHTSVHAILNIAVLPRVGMLGSIMISNSVSVIPSFQVMRDHRHDVMGRKLLLLLVSLAQASSLVVWSTMVGDMTILLPVTVIIVSIGLQQKQLWVLENIQSNTNKASTERIWQDMLRSGCRIVVYAACFAYALFNYLQLTTVQDEKSSIFSSINLPVVFTCLAVHCLSMIGFHFCAKLFLTMSSHWVFFMTSIHVFLPAVVFFFTFSSSSFSHVALIEESYKHSSEFKSSKMMVIWMVWILSQATVNIYSLLKQKELIGSRKWNIEMELQSGLFLEQSLYLIKEVVPTDEPCVNENDQRAYNFDMSYDSSTMYSGYNNNEHESFEDIIKVYACATMWHETRDEMKKLLKSLCVMDEYCNSSKANIPNMPASSPFVFESHIFFDDAFENNTSQKKVNINSFVKDFLSTITEAAESVYGKPDQLSSPRKMSTPYGGQLQYILPGGTTLTVHLKNRNKIRIKKRWSQVMYLYYLLGHKIMSASTKPQHIERMSKNTFLLVLDGDVIFEPYAVQHLVRRMVMNDRLAAVCGRVHPVGSGPLVWYQTFEYAVSHWLCKAAEDVVGSILCSPGCFSLLRARPLMDDNIINQFVSKSTTPLDFILHDQGEDRWLCTLLMQRGHSVEYSAVSDVYTNAPQSLSEFFAQRKRWMPSTIAHSFDLLYNYESLMKVNHRITMSYIAYQMMMMMITLCSPSVIFLLTIRSLQRLLSLDLDSSLCINLFFLLVYIFTCLVCSQETQITCAKIWTVVYFGLLIETLLSISYDILMTGSSTSASIMICTFVIPLLTAIVHPMEFSSFRHLLVYWLLTPCTNLLLPIYVIFNISQISWGTRETPEAAKDNQDDEEFLSRRRRPSLIEVLTESPRLLQTLSQEIPCHDVGQTLLSLLDESNNKVNKDRKYSSGERKEDRRRRKIPILAEPKSLSVNRTSEWMQNEALSGLETKRITETEETFWEQVIQNRLHPITMDSSARDSITTQLFTFKWKCVIGFFGFNIAVMAFLLLPEKLGLYFDIYGNMITNSSSLMSDPFNILLILTASLLFVLQFLVMLVHRYRTLSDIILESSCNNLSASEGMTTIKKETP